MTSPSFTTPTGTQDVLPDDWPYMSFVIDNAFDVAALYGYRRIETPIFAEAELFARSSGETTDIVQKEMYVFQDRDGTRFALRPEGTAPVMRAYFEHGMHKLVQPVKLSYLERMYRAERPQRGRYREHRQFGCEAIGSDDAFVDVEMISLLDTFYRRIGLDGLELHINSIGDGNCRPAYTATLAEYLRANAARLSGQDRDRIERSPLRVLDSKDAESQTTIEGAPRALDFLCEACREHWSKLRRGLDLLGIDYAVDPRLVRGMDYYTRTVFEFMPPSGGRQSVVGGGGRYDALAEYMGGPPVPGIGFGTGIERLILSVKERGIDVPNPPGLSVFVAHAGAGTDDGALQLAASLRQAGIATDMGFGARSLKAQLRQAGGENAAFAAIVGEDELAEGTVTLRSLVRHSQERIPIDRVVEAVQEA